MTVQSRRLIEAANSRQFVRGRLRAREPPSTFWRMKQTRIGHRRAGSSRGRGLAVVLGSGLLMGLGAVGCTTEIVNHVQAPAESQGLVVTGSGKVTAAPDTAVVNIGVETREADPKAAVDRNTQEMTTLVAGLKALGIADADLQTSNFNIRFERIEPHWPVAQSAPAAAPVTMGKSAPTAAVQPPKPEKPAIEGVFVVTNTLNVTVRELAKLGEVLSSSTAAGANSVWGVDFRIDKPEPLVAQARDKAVADALEKAKRLAEVSGTKLGRLVAIEESGRGGPMPVGAMFSAREAKASVPIEAGSLEVSADVVVRFALE